MRSRYLPRTVFACLCLSLLLQAQSHAPDKVFATVLDDLKGETSLPILLPDALPPLLSPSVFASASAEPNGYAIRLESEPDCDHAQVCFLGIFRATQGAAFTFPVIVTIGRLQGRFKPVTCGGSCSPASIEWKAKGVLYTVQLALKTRDERESKVLMVKLAENALMRGLR